MSSVEIIVNQFRNPEFKINIEINNLEKEENNRLIIVSNDNNMEEEIKKENLYFLNRSSSNNLGKIICLVFKNINIDLSKSNNIYFESLESLYLNNSILLNSQKDNNLCNFENLKNFIIKGDLNIIKQNLLNFKKNDILSLINQLTIKIISKSSAKMNLFNLIKSLEIYILGIKNSFNIYFKGLLADLDFNKIERPSKEKDIFSKINKIYLYSLNKINSKSSKIIKEELIDKLNNLEELYINENINFELGNKLKFCNTINNNEDININYNLYNIDKLTKISIPICEYNKTKKFLLLYGEANMSFYNSNNKELLFNIIKNNHKGNLLLLSLCNFDYENINYLNELIENINLTEKIEIRNLNINEKFISILKNKKLFDCNCITIDNIIFADDEIETKFYNYINTYNKCKYLKLISLEDFSKYNDLIVNDNLNKLLLEEIYEMNYEILKELILKRKVAFSEITFKNLQIGEEKNKEIIIDIISHCKDEIQKLKIIGHEFNFIIKEIQEKQIYFNRIEKLILHLDNEDGEENNEKGFLSSDKDKINYLENNFKLFNYNGIKKIDLGIFSIKFNERKKIMNLFNHLYELN